MVMKRYIIYILLIVSTVLLLQCNGNLVEVETIPSPIPFDGVNKLQVKFWPCKPGQLISFTTYTQVTNYCTYPYTEFTNFPVGGGYMVGDILDNWYKSNGTKIQIKYERPRVYSVVGNPSTEGGEITVKGEGFGYPFNGSYPSVFSFPTPPLSDGTPDIYPVRNNYFPQDIKVYVSSGTGLIKFNMNTGGMVVNNSVPLEYRYASPIIDPTTSIFPLNYQQNNNITIKGLNFGRRGPINIRMGNVTLTPPLVRDHRLLVLTIPPIGSNLPIGNIEIEVDGSSIAKANYAYIYTTKVDPVLTNGGNVTLYGWFGQPEYYNLSIIINQFSQEAGCTILERDVNRILASCPIVLHKYFTKTLKIYANNILIHTTIFSVEKPVIEQVTGTPFAGGNVTIAGWSFDTPCTVTIEGDNCDEPSVNSALNQITCYFDGKKYQNTNKDAFNVTVTTYGETGSARAFQYNTNDNCGIDNCNNRGTCINGNCVCFEHYTGPSCESQIDKLEPPLTPPKVSAISTQLDAAKGFLTHIVEVDWTNGESVRSIQIQDGNWDYKEIMDSTRTKYYGKFSSNPNITVLIIIDQYNDITNVIRGSESIFVYPNTVSYQIRITGWTFINPRNSLKLVYSIEYSNEYYKGYPFCPGSLTTNTNSAFKDNTKPLTWIKMVNGLQVAVIKFNDRVLIDDILTINPLQWINPLQDQYLEAYYRDRFDNKTQVVTTQFIPSFKNYAQVYNPLFQSYSNISASLCIYDSSENPLVTQTTSTQRVSIISVSILTILSLLLL